MEAETLQLIAIFVILLEGLVGGTIPFWFKGASNYERLLSLGYAFSGGVFLATALIHMLPDALENFHVDTSISDVYWVSLIMIIGFAILFMIEHALFKIFPEFADQYAPVMNVRRRSSADSFLNEMTGQSSALHSVSTDARVDGGASPPVPGGPLPTLVAEEDLPQLEGSHHGVWILLLAMSIHCLITGFAIGTLTDFDMVLSMVIAVVAHKWCETFSVSTSSIRLGVPRCTTIGMDVALALFTPTGIAIGMLCRDALMSSIGELLQGGVLAFATGTFLYVGIGEILFEEFIERDSEAFAEESARAKGVKLAALLIGALLMVLVAVLE